MKKSDDIDIRIGIMRGCNSAQKDILTLCALSPYALAWKMKSKLHRSVINKVEAWTRESVASTVEERTQKAEEEIEERKRRLLSKGYRIIEKTLDHGLSRPESEVPEPRHIRAAELGIERMEGKAVDRQMILRREETYRLDVDGSDIQQMLEEIARVSELRRKALPAAPPEMELGAK